MTSDLTSKGYTPNSSTHDFQILLAAFSFRPRIRRIICNSSVHLEDVPAYLYFRIASKVYGILPMIDAAIKLGCGRRQQCLHLSVQAFRGKQECSLRDAVSWCRAQPTFAGARAPSMIASAIATASAGVEGYEVWKI